MGAQEIERRLAAILAAALVGCSRLMVEGENLLDDGVNFAARLVTLAEGGRNCEPRSQQ